MLKEIEEIKSLDRKILTEKLSAKNEEQEKLFEMARYVRDNSKFGKKVEFRSVIELSNICRQKCRYCCIGRDNSKTYKLTYDEIFSTIKRLAKRGRRTFLLQSGESVSQSFIDDIARVCEDSVQFCPEIKIILNLGNLSDEQYLQLKNSGAKRYLLKFETSNSELHKFCRPTDSFENRLEHIKKLIALGFQVGTGNIVGLPKQTTDDLIDDLLLTTTLDLSMVSASKFIPNSQTEFRDEPIGDINLTLNYIALLRILNPNCLIPSTSSMKTNGIDGQLMGLLAGCNTVTVHDGTPSSKETDFNIYTKDRFTPQENYCLKIIEQAGMTAAPYLL